MTPRRPTGLCRRSGRIREPAVGRCRQRARWTARWTAACSRGEDAGPGGAPVCSVPWRMVWWYRERVCRVGLLLGLQYTVSLAAWHRHRLPRRSPGHWSPPRSSLSTGASLLLRRSILGALVRDAILLTSPVSTNCTIGVRWCSGYRLTTTLPGLSSLILLGRMYIHTTLSRGPTDVYPAVL